MTSDFFEIDFLSVESAKSGDAIPLRYKVNGATTIHVVDGGFQNTGDAVVEHINKYYNSPDRIDHVVATHPDGDHAGGLRAVLEEFEIGVLWMHRPWIYAQELLHRFEHFTSAEGLAKRLRDVYPNLAALEDIAEDKGIEIREVFYGSKIGEFTVLSPTKDLLLDLIVESEKTPESTSEGRAGISGATTRFVEKVFALVRSAWGEEIFSKEETSAENEMSAVQYACLNDEKLLLTGDAGRRALSTAIEFAPALGISLSALNRFQVPHHGSRRNLSTEILDSILCPRINEDEKGSVVNGSAYISSAKEDTHHPKKVVLRACMHRGYRVFTTEGNSLQAKKDAPARDGWGPVIPAVYPEDQEEA